MKMTRAIKRPKWLNIWLVAALWLATALFTYLGPVGFFKETVEGIDPAQIPWWPTIIFIALLLDSAALTLWWALTIPAAKFSQDADSDATLASGRRRFLTGSAAMTGGAIGVAGAGLAGVSGWRNVTRDVFWTEVETSATDPKDFWQGAEIQSYRPLGSTGLKVSDISIGSTRLHQNADPVGFLGALLDRGVNYIDASPDYAPQSEGIIKESIKGRDRDKLVLATKFCHAEGHLRQGSSVAEYMQSME